MRCAHRVSADLDGLATSVNLLTKENAHLRRENAVLRRDVDEWKAAEAFGSERLGELRRILVGMSGIADWIEVPNQARRAMYDSTELRALWDAVRAKTEGEALDILRPVDARPETYRIVTAIFSDPRLAWSCGYHGASGTDVQTLSAHVSGTGGCYSMGVAPATKGIPLSHACRPPKGNPTREEAIVALRDIVRLPNLKVSPAMTLAHAAEIAKRTLGDE